jgi:hypothetical protein
MQIEKGKNPIELSKSYNSVASTTQPNSYHLFLIPVIIRIAEEIAHPFYRLRRVARRNASTPNSHLTKETN